MVVKCLINRSGRTHPLKGNWHLQFILQLPSKGCVALLPPSVDSRVEVFLLHYLCSV